MFSPVMLCVRFPLLTNGHELSKNPALWDPLVLVEPCRIGMLTRTASWRPWKCIFLASFSCCQTLGHASVWLRFDDCQLRHPLLSGKDLHPLPCGPLFHLSSQQAASSKSFLLVNCSASPYPVSVFSSVATLYWTLPLPESGLALASSDGPERSPEARPAQSSRLAYCVWNKQPGIPGDVLGCNLLHGVSPGLMTHLSSILGFWENLFRHLGVLFFQDQQGNGGSQRFVGATVGKL